MKQKTKFIKVFRWGGIFLLLALAGIILVVDAARVLQDGRIGAEKMRADFIDQQRRKIKSEVERVAIIINHEVSQSTRSEEERIRGRVYEAYSIAENIYNENKSDKTDGEIRKMIIDALRPVRFSRNGYYFINSMTGDVWLSPEQPAMEGQNCLNTRDANGKYMVQEAVHLMEEVGEGFLQYSWLKPGGDEKSYVKRSFAKKFEPLNCFIGTGGYLDNNEKQMQKAITQHVKNHRFGIDKMGYVFILDLKNIQGGKNFAIMYANANRPDLIGKYISDDLQDAKGKMFRKEFLKGLREHGECYVDYWYKKFDDPDPSPKTSFFKLAGGGRFIVAAGVYLDDVERDISLMQAVQSDKLKESMVFFIAIVIGALAVFFVLFHRLSQQIQMDCNLFTDFFSRAAYSDIEIDRDQIKFGELDQMAEYANKMLHDKKAVGKKLREEREQLLVTLHAIGDAVITTDTEKNVVLMNKVAEKLTGWKQSEVVGMALWDVLHVTDDSSKMKIVDLLDTMQLEEGSAGEKRALLLHPRNADICHIACRIAPIKDTEGLVLGNVIVFRDETLRLKNEKEILKVKKLESIGLLAGGIAHDFNNIMTSLFGHIELALQYLPKDHQAYSHVDTANQAREKAVQLTRQLLTFAKGGTPVIEAVNLKEILEQTVQFNLTGSDIKPHIRTDKDLWNAKADKGQINQVFANLAINAAQAMPSGGHLFIDAENVEDPEETLIQVLKGKFVRIRIRDEGCGISSENLEKIFDPYFTTKETGSGLGLTTVRSIVRKHNGCIRVDSELGEGTIFSVYLPAAESGDMLVSSPQPDLNGLTKPSLRILVMDDDDTIRMLLSEILVSCGHSVKVIGDGTQVKKVYLAARDEGNPFDLVIMDLTIPGGMGGKEAVKILLACDPEAKVIASSGYSNDPVLAHSADYGFKGKVAKPFLIDTLMKELYRVHCI